jgi:hypothetical protein
MDVMQMQRDCCGGVPEAPRFGPSLPQRAWAHAAGEMPD